MSRIEKTFQMLSTEKRVALIPYITAGDPNPSITVPLMHAMVEAGADIIELGIPFSDPMAEGPVIQAACERALRHNVSLHNIFDMVVEFRKTNATTPVVLMGYANPIEVMGYNDFAKKAVEVGVDGVITVDLPPEESSEPLKCFKQYGLDPIFLVAPTSTDQRIEQICNVTGGFVYYVSLKGVTGASSLNTDEVRKKITHIRQFTNLPIGVGFGIKDAETAAQIGEFANAVVVGSAVVKHLANHEAQPDETITNITKLLTGIRKALDNIVTAKAS